MPIEAAGIHHVTALASDAQRILDFYGGVLGLRLVKRTVNFDAPTGHHFYFGDERGTPGTLLTFFPVPRARKGRAGIGQAAVTSFAIRPASVGYWIERLVQTGVAFDNPVTRFDDERVIALKGPDDLLLELVAHASVNGTAAGWVDGPVPAEHAIRGLYGTTLWLDDHHATAELLTTRLGLRAEREQGSIYRFVASGSGLGRVVDIRHVPGLWRGAAGAGVVHHVAFRVDDEGRQLALRNELVQRGLTVTPQVDRFYFRSIYFHEPGGVLLEVATEHPGFTIDEPLAELGRALALPPWLEPRRAKLEAALPHVTALTDSDSLFA